MVIGNGLIANAFLDYANNKDIIIFASGVSNSLETNQNIYNREKDLIKTCLEKNLDKTFVYFSSIFQPDAYKQIYMQHKMQMEFIIQALGKKFIILRLPQVIGKGGNANTLINFIVNKLKNNETIDVYKNTYRSLIDVADVERIIYTLCYIENNFGVYNLNSIEKLEIKNIVLLVANQLNKIAKINLIPAKVSDIKYNEPRNSLIFKSLFEHLNINSKGYTESIIKKYINLWI
jgi:nucleoside-diphosphate-sugar epimerase